MSHQCLADAFAPAEEHFRQVVMYETWGHLAPRKNKTYTGRIVYAIGCYESGHLNPTPITIELKGLDSSPFFFEAIHEWLQSLDEAFRQEGSVYEFTGSFRNYEFVGKLKKVFP